MERTYHGVTCPKCKARFAQVEGCDIVPPHICKKKNNTEVNLMSFRLELEALITEREEMRWENEQRLLEGKSIAYGAEAFGGLSASMRKLKEILGDL